MEFLPAAQVPLCTGNYLDILASNTEKYVHWNRQLYQQWNDRYHFAAVSTIDEAGKLIETGYEYVTDMEGMKLFRKPK